MGYSTTIIIYNDVLNEIEEDPDFASELVKAIRINYHTKRPVSLVATAPRYAVCSAGQVIEQHHSSDEVLIKVSGNTGEVVNAKKNKK